MINSRKKGNQEIYSTKKKIPPIWARYTYITFRVRELQNDALAIQWAE